MKNATATSFGNTNTSIKEKILTIRGQQVMLDSDLAQLYDTPVKRLNQQVKRNAERFPERFMFQLTKEEFTNLRSQFVTSSWGGVRKLPYAFTEQGVAMLSTVLKSKSAVKVSIDIMDAFVAMRRFFQLNENVLLQLEQLRRMQMAEHTENAAKFDTIFEALERGNLLTTGLLLPNSEFESLRFVTRLIETAKEEIILIDPYSDAATLDILAKKHADVRIQLVCRDRGNPTQAEITKFNRQYGGLGVTFTDKFHDRFIIIDRKELHNLGSSINSLGRRLTTYSSRDPKEIDKLLSLIE